MNINSLNSFTPSPLESPTSLSSQTASSTGLDKGSNSFGSSVRNAIDALDGSQKTAEKEIASTVAGESPDLHKTIIALQTADLNFQLGLQVRNKFIGAYEEIMRMQV